jgi:hypothetical protein
LFVVNNKISRAVPTLEYGYGHDGIDVRSELGREFMLRAEGVPAKERSTPRTAENSFWATFQVP